ncbi:MAG: hypothetical protein QXF26_08005 [Candidatus Bathyarchaeia archaeon]
MSYKKRSTPQYDRRAFSRSVLKSFVNTFDKERVKYRRQRVVRDIEVHLKKLKEEELDSFYENLLGRKPEELDIAYDITMDPSRTIALVPQGVPQSKRLKIDSLQQFCAEKPKPAKPLKFYKETAKDGKVKIGRAYYNAETLASALRVLGKDCCIHEPKKPDVPLMLQNKNGDRIFIAPIVESVD